MKFDEHLRVLEDFDTSGFQMGSNHRSVGVFELESMMATLFLGKLKSVFEVAENLGL